MRVLITGAAGQLGYHLKQALAAHELILADTDNYDITQSDLIQKQTALWQPEAIIHAAAYTNVDRAEDQRQLAYEVNVTGSLNVAKAAKAVKARLFFISTDYVFNGQASSPYRIDQPTEPISYYGQTKAEAEAALTALDSRTVICRTSWLYGGPKPQADYAFLENGVKNFVYTILKLAKQAETGASLPVVSDQVGSPTYAADLALALAKLVERKDWPSELPRICHLTGEGTTNWAEFAEAILELTGLDQERQLTIEPISSDEYAKRFPLATRRPAYSVLDQSDWQRLGIELRPWRIALADFLSDWSAR